MRCISFDYYGERSSVAIFAFGKLSLSEKRATGIDASAPPIGASWTQTFCRRIRPKMLPAAISDLRARDRNMHGLCGSRVRSTGAIRYLCAAKPDTEKDFRSLTSSAHASLVEPVPRASNRHEKKDRILLSRYNSVSRETESQDERYKQSTTRENTACRHTD